MPEIPEFPFQSSATRWTHECIGDVELTERTHRFLEECVETAQATGRCTREEAHLLVDYVFNRPAGDLQQEVGGVMITLAGLCTALSINMLDAGYRELRRVWGLIDSIREKHKNKPRRSPLPGGVSAPMRQTPENCPENAP